MQIVSEIAFIRYAEQSVCIISRNCCRSSIKGFNQKMYIYAQAWSGCLLQLLRDSRLLNWFVVHHPQRLKSSHLDIFSKCILSLFYALVLILSIYLFLSMFIPVFCQFIDFLLFYCLGASLCCLFPVLRTFYDWIHIFPIIATRSHQVNRTFAIHPCSSADRT